MEIVGGFMVMMSIIGFFLAVVWLVMPFVVFAIKGKQDRTLEVMEAIEKRLATIETSLNQVSPKRDQAASLCVMSGDSEAPINSATDKSNHEESQSL